MVVIGFGLPASGTELECFFNELELRLGLDCIAASAEVLTTAERILPLPLPNGWIGSGSGANPGRKDFGVVNNFPCCARPLAAKPGEMRLPIPSPVWLDGPRVVLPFRSMEQPLIDSVFDFFMPLSFRMPTAKLLFLFNWHSFSVSCISGVSVRALGIEAVSDDDCWICFEGFEVLSDVIDLSAGFVGISSVDSFLSVPFDWPDGIVAPVTDDSDVRCFG